MSSSSEKFKSLSKFLSLVLRHNPSAAHISLDPNGWANVNDLIAGVTKAGKKGFSSAVLEEIVASDSKMRYSFNDDHTLIRANQGHSVSVDLQFQPVQPPSVLYHGTATRFLSSILESGLIPGSRTHVHLSADLATATAVGKRHGKPVILIVNAQEMAAQGIAFYLSANGVWLVDKVPPHFLTVTSEDDAGRAS